jgi:hypothetical protein
VSLCFHDPLLTVEQPKSGYTSITICQLIQDTCVKDFAHQVKREFTLPSTLDWQEGAAAVLRVLIIEVQVLQLITFVC